MEEEGPYLCLDNTPPLSNPGSKTRPDLLPHAHVLVRHALQLFPVQVVYAPSLQQSLVAFTAGVGRLGGEVGPLDAGPVVALSSC